MLGDPPRKADWRRWLTPALQKQVAFPGCPIMASRRRAAVTRRDNFFWGGWESQGMWNMSQETVGRIARHDVKFLILGHGSIAQQDSAHYCSQS